jgi:hypothetical protein
LFEGCVGDSVISDYTSTSASEADTGTAADHLGHFALIQLSLSFALLPFSLCLPFTPLYYNSLHITHDSPIYKLWHL